MVGEGVVRSVVVCCELAGVSALAPSDQCSDRVYSYEYSYDLY